MHSIASDCLLRTLRRKRQYAIHSDTSACFSRWKNHARKYTDRSNKKQTLNQAGESHACLQIAVAVRRTGGGMDRRQSSPSLEIQSLDRLPACAVAEASD